MLTKANVVAAPSIPHPEALDSVRALCEDARPYEFGPTADALFVTAMQEAVRWHEARSSFYARLLKQNDFRVQDIRSIEDCARIPMIPATFFKSHQVRSISPEQVALTLTSSGTTGQKSQMFFDDWSIRAPQRMVEFIFDLYGWTTPHTPTNYILYSYEVERDSRLGTAYTDQFLCGFAPVNHAFYALRRNGMGGHEFDVFGTIAALERYAQEGLPVRLLGFPSFLHATVERMKKLNHPALRLPPESLVFLGGGWKGQADQAVSRDALYQSVHEWLGIPLDRIRDGFGSVEHCIPYVECGHHRFHVPQWSRVFIRDLNNLEVVPYGREGFLHFVSPYITSVPAHSVMMGDLARLQAPGSCPCGNPTSWFEILGRAGLSRNKSCAVAAAELLKGSAV